jgi:choline kinase
VRGIVLAAGGGTRLRPLTDELPKTLLAVDGDRTILELVIANLASSGIEQITVVSGHEASAIDAVVPGLAASYEVDVDVRFNPRYDTANNAYSLWTVRDHLETGVLLVNGDTVHPVSVEERLLEARGSAPLLLACDTVKPLADEEMKVSLDEHGRIQRISKGIDPVSASGEYIGVCVIEPEAAAPLVASLERTFEADPGRWYEDGFQDYIDMGGHVGAVPIGEVEWGEIDDHTDLERVRSFLCPS